MVTARLWCRVKLSDNCQPLHFNCLWTSVAIPYGPRKIGPRTKPVRVAAACADFVPVGDHRLTAPDDLGLKHTGLRINSPIRRSVRWTVVDSASKMGSGTNSQPTRRVLLTMGSCNFSEPFPLSGSSVSEAQRLVSL